MEKLNKFNQKIAFTTIIGVIGVSSILATPQEANAEKASASSSADWNLEFDINGVVDNVSGIFANPLIAGNASADVNGNSATGILNPSSIDLLHKSENKR